MVVNGIRHVAPVIHGPVGCTYGVANAYKMSGCEYRGVPLEPTSCTALDETNVVYGGEGKLVEAIKEAEARYHPELIVVLSCCCSGIIGDDVETIAEEARQHVNAEVIAIRSEGFGGDFRSGYEDAFKAIMELMEPPRQKRPKTINILGARVGPTYTEWQDDLDEIIRMVRSIDVDINAILCGGCTVEEIRRAREVELNASWCYDWGQKLGDLMQERFGIAYSRTGQPYGLQATEEWLMGVAVPLGLEKKAREFIDKEMDNVKDDVESLKRNLDGRTVLVEIAEFPGPIRALSIARMAEEFGARPVVINLHPYTIKERMPSIKFLIETGQNPEIVLTKGIFSLGTFRSSWQTEFQLEKLVTEYDDVIFFGTPMRQPGVPQVNMTTRTGYPHYGYRGIKNMARLVASAVDNADRPRSKLFRRVLYGDW
jgi:nitrogenase molybdenum-iron protein alpha/beta subunit